MKSDDYFSIGLFGEFLRGKTTIINALLGQGFLPADILPSKGIITYIRWGCLPQGEIRYKDGTVRKFTVEEFRTELRNTNYLGYSTENVEKVILFLPNDLLRNNVELIDIPGTNNCKEIDTVVDEIAEKVDAAVMVLSPGSPVSTSEYEFISGKLKKYYTGKLLYVVNKVDTVRINQREIVIQKIKERIQSVVSNHIEGEGKPEELQLFGISAAKALDYQLGKCNDSSMYFNFLAFKDSLKRMIQKNNSPT